MTCVTAKRLFVVTICFFLRFGLATCIKLDVTIRFVVLLIFLTSALLIMHHPFLLYLWPWVTTFVRPDFVFFFCFPVCFLAFRLLLYIAT